MLRKKSVKQFQSRIFTAALLLSASLSTGVVTPAYAADAFDELAPVAQPESAQPQIPSAQPATPAQPDAAPESSDGEENTVLV